MEKAKEWTRHLIDEVARRRHTDTVKCAQELRVLIQIAVGERAYEMGLLEELTFILTGTRPVQAMSLDAGLAVESQIAIHAAKIADAIRRFEEACQADRSTSGRFKRLLTGAEPVQTPVGQRLVEQFHYLCSYLEVDKPEIEPREVKEFLQTAIGAMPQPRASDHTPP